MSAVLKPDPQEGSQGCADAAAPTAIWLEPWASASDEALRAHYAGPRAIHFDNEVDPQEVMPARIEGILHGRFEFNGETHTLGRAPAWLHNPSRDVEWHILLHKFYYAVGLGRGWQVARDMAYVRRWCELIDSWIAVTPPGFIAADVTGRRVQHWIYSLKDMVFDQPTTPVEGTFLRRMLVSLHEQVEHLCAHLTAKRNHRTLELQAIFLAGVVFPEFRRAAHWRRFALDETVRNIDADLQADGVHCEQSTDYHHLALRNWMQVRELAARHGESVPPLMDRRLVQALEFSMHVHRPDGEVPSFSDGDVRSYLPLLARGARLYARPDMLYVATQGSEGTPPVDRVAHFETSGYHVIRSGWSQRTPFAEAQHLVFDCGPLGEGNHGHFDALSFELSAFGHPLVVDPGRYTYSEAAGPDGVNWRVQFRSTAVHNTVSVDGLNQTAYTPRPIKETSRHLAGSVRHKISGPAPDVMLVERSCGADVDLLHGRCASHAYDAVHERCVVFIGRRYWIVSDWLRAPSEHGYVLNHQLDAYAEGWVCVTDDERCVRVNTPHLVLAQPRRPGQALAVGAGWVSRLYGHKASAPTVRTSARGACVDFDTVLFPWRDAPVSLRVTDCPVHGDDAPGPCAQRIQWSRGFGEVHDGWFHARGQLSSHWRIGTLRFQGRWLHWREDAEGRVLHAVSHAGATLDTPDGPVQLERGNAP